MSDGLAALLWLLGLAVAVMAAEGLVRCLTLLGERYRFTPALLGLLVALGADGPEVTSAVVAAVHGRRQLGLGVVLGSNIYNLAGLLGLSAVLAGYVVTSRRFVGPSEGLNVALCLLLVAILFSPAAHTALAVVLIVGICYGFAVSIRSPSSENQVHEPRADHRSFRGWPPTRVLLAGTCAAAALIVVGSEVVVRSSIYLGPRLGISAAVTGTFILAVSTSLPNTWAAISLARRRMSAEAISTTFNSNSINIAIGIGAPSIVVALREPLNLMILDTTWLLGMTTITILMLAIRPALTRGEGCLLIALYLAFVFIRLTAF